MPSLLDHLALGDGAEPVSPPPGLLDSVKADGARRRGNRHRRNLGLAVLCLALLAVPAATLRAGDGTRPDDMNVAASGDGTGTTLALEPLETTVSTEPDPDAPTSAVGTAPPPTDAPAASVVPPATQATTAPPKRAPATTTTTARLCRNSDNPACGEFRWDPAPAPNQPLVASFTKAPATAVVGQPVAFEVTWSDGDARLTFDRLATDGTAIGTACTLAPRYGPWTPPPAVGGSGTLPYTTSFPAAGVYGVTVELGTADCTSPYGNDKLVQTTITVSEPPAP